MFLEQGLCCSAAVWEQSSTELSAGGAGEEFGVPAWDVATCFSCQISDFDINISEVECSGWDPSRIFGHSC